MTDPHNEPVPLRADDNRFSGLIRSTRRVATLFAACEASAKRCQQHQAPDEIGLTAEYEDDIDELTAAVGELRVLLSNADCLDYRSVLAIQIKRLKKSVEHLDGGYDPLAFEAIASVADRLEATKQVVGDSETAAESGREHEPTVIEIAFALFEYACEKLELETSNRGVSRRAFDYLIKEGLPPGFAEPTWYQDKNFVTFSDYLTKHRRRTGNSVYQKGAGVETRSVKRKTKLDQPRDRS
jgi:hypothetical protein